MLMIDIILANLINTIKIYKNIIRKHKDEQKPKQIKKK